MGSRPVGRLLVPIVLALVAGSLYLTRLTEAPRYVARDEIVYSLNAQSLASTGRDLNGRYLPMYIEYPKGFGRPTWDQPLLIYAIAATLKILPFSEFSMRLPMAIAAVVDVLLIYFIGRLLFGSTALAITAALLLAITPAHFIHGRMATDFQLWVPFTLGWLLCVLLYLRRRAPMPLFAAGVLLGIGLYGYVAAYLLVPISALLTFAVLYRQRGPVSRYLVFVAGVLTPTIVCLPWMLRSPLPFRDILAHYAVTGDAGATAASGIATSMWRRLAEVPMVYLSFWDPRFLLVDGPIRFRSTQITPVFLTPLAGLLVLGVVRAFRRRDPADLLVLAAFATAPIPPSLAGESQAVWRALQLAPFGVLLATSGIAELACEKDPRRRWIDVLVTFAAIIALGVWYHDVLPQAQALVRAATVPLAVAGLAFLLSDDGLRALPKPQIAIASLAALVTMHGVYLVFDVATIAATLVLAVLCLWIPSRPRWLSERPLVSVAILALAVGHFMFVYVDYGSIHPVGVVPARLIVLALRLIVASATLAVLFLIALPAATPPTDPGVGHWRVLSVILGVVFVQLAYFAIDAYSAAAPRIAQAAVVIAVAVAVARVIRPRPAAPRRIATVAIVGIVCLVVIRFAAFHDDYFNAFQVRGSVDQEGNVRLPFEKVIDRAAAGSVPSVYLGRIGPYAGGDLYWRFYLLKHRREDLASRTVMALDFLPDRIHALAPGSLIVTSPTKQDDAVLDEMERRGDFRSRELIKAPDGSPIFWLLEKS